MEEINIYELEERAHKQGKAGFSAWLHARRTGEDTLINVDAISEGEVMPDQPVTIDQIKELFVEEREHTREMIQSFIDNNFDPAMETIDAKFEHIDDHLDRLDIEVVTLRTDVRQIKRYLRATSPQAS